MLDGAAKISELIAEVARQEMPAIAMTDHGNVFGAFEFHKLAKAAGVKPIIGIEAYNRVYVLKGVHDECDTNNTKYRKFRAADAIGFY
mgnify:CR=1 FL=1